MRGFAEPVFPALKETGMFYNDQGEQVEGARFIGFELVFCARDLMDRYKEIKDYQIKRDDNGDITLTLKMDGRKEGV